MLILSGFGVFFHSSPPPPPLENHGMVSLVPAVSRAPSRPWSWPPLALLEPALRGICGVVPSLANSASLQRPWLGGEPSEFLSCPPSGSPTLVVCSQSSLDPASAWHAAWPSLSMLCHMRCLSLVLFIFWVFQKVSLNGGVHWGAGGRGGGFFPFSLSSPPLPIIPQDPKERLSSLSLCCTLHLLQRKLHGFTGTLRVGSWWTKEEGKGILKMIAYVYWILTMFQTLSNYFWVLHALYLEVIQFTECMLYVY